MASSKYFEYLGRKDSAPFTMDQLHYEELEPNKVKAINEDIDADIKDHRAWMTDNIQMFNSINVPRSRRWEQVAKLTKAGAEILDRRQKYSYWDSEFEKQEKAAKNPEISSQFRDVTIKIENERQDLNVDAMGEIGHMETHNGVAKDGTKMELTGVADFKLNVVTEDRRNGNHATRAMIDYLPMYMSIAMKDLTVNGKFYHDMTPTEKIQWRRIAGARYVQMWREKHPNISDRQIISMFMPVYLNNDTRLNGEASNTYINAANAEANKVESLGYINNIIAGAKNHKAGQDLYYVDEIFSRNSYIQKKESYFRGQGYGDRSMKMANDAWAQLIIDNIGKFDEETIRFLTEKYTFTPKGQNKEVFYGQIQPNNTSKIIAAFNNQASEDHDLLLQNKLNFLENHHRENKIPLEFEQIKIFHGTKYWTAAESLFKMSNTHDLDRADNKLNLDKFNSGLKTYVTDAKIHPQTTNTTWQLNAYDKLNRIARDKFSVYYAEYESTDQPNAAELAVDKVLTELRNRDYDYVLTSPTQVNKDTGVEFKDLMTIYKKNPMGTLNSSEILEAEKGRVANAANYFDGKEELGTYWRNLAKLFPGLDSTDVAYLRLRALYPKEFPINADLEAKINLGISRQNRTLLNKNNEYASTIRVALSPNEDWNEALNLIIDPKTKENGGVDAMKVNGQYQAFKEGDKLLSSYTTGDIIDAVIGGQLSKDTELGLYGLTAGGLVEIWQNGNVDSNAVFDERTQTLLILERLRYKANNKQQFSNADSTYRRLVYIPEADREEFKALVGDLGPFMDLNTLLFAAKNELVNRSMP
mgnify:CR=1 FL=1